MKYLLSEWHQREYYEYRTYNFVSQTPQNYFIRYNTNSNDKDTSICFFIKQYAFFYKEKRQNVHQFISQPLARKKVQQEKVDFFSLLKLHISSLSTHKQFKYLKIDTQIDRKENKKRKGEMDLPLIQLRLSTSSTFKLFKHRQKYRD